MPDHDDAAGVNAIPCCPDLEQGDTCDTLDFRYRLPWRLSDARVDLILHYRLERCSGPLARGDLAYSTTLLPGEQVRIYTSDRHTRWSYDAETDLSYRHETTSEESYYTWGMARAMSDLSISESGSSSSSYEEDWASGGGGLSVDLFGIVEIGGGGSGGSFDAESSKEFSRNLTQHAESSSSYVAAGVRAKSATSVGEVHTRHHAEGESESHLESASRSFHNPNRCHAVTYFFYKINKLQTIRFRLVAVERSLADPAAPTLPDRVIRPKLAGRVMVRPEALRATAKDRLEIERMARQAAVEREEVGRGVVSASLMSTALRTGVFHAQPAPAAARKAALDAVDKELVKAGIIDRETGEPTKAFVQQNSWERREWLPTPGLIVKGCLDECGTCEPALERKIALELDRQKLENDLLKRQIELLDQAQEYRCCPGAAEDDDEG
jgi:hypothetical protein